MVADREQDVRVDGADFGVDVPLEVRRVAAVVAESRESTGRGLADRQRRALEAMTDEE